MRDLIVTCWGLYLRYLLIPHLVLAAAPILWTMHKSKHLKGTQELNSQYEAFSRKDYKHFSKLKGVLTNFLSLYFPLRFVISCALIALLVLISLVTMIGHRQGTPVAKWRTYGLHVLSRPLLRLLMLMVGVVWIERTRSTADYSKYLGTGWCQEFEGAGIQIANHSSWLDIVQTLYMYETSFMAKDAVASYPGVGIYA